jgi:O-antigen/teichoic acid export membrane protein
MIQSVFPNSKETLQYPLSLKENFSWAFFGNVFDGIFQWAILIILAKVGTPVMLGQYILGISICSPVMMFADLDLRILQSTDQNKKYSFIHYFSLETINSVIGLAIIIILIFISAKSEHFQVILAVGLSQAIRNISSSFYGLFQQNERMDYISKSLLLKGFISLIVFGLLIWITNNLVCGIIGFISVWLVLMLTYDVSRSTVTLFILKDVRFLFGRNLNKIISLAWLGLPLGIVAALTSLNVNIPRYFVEHHLGITALGIFGAVVYISESATKVVMSLMQTVNPRLSRHYLKKEKKAFLNLLYKVALIILVLGIVGVLVAIFFGKLVLTLAYNSDYAQYEGLLVWIMVVAAIRYATIPLRNIMIIARWVKVQLLTRIVSLLLLFILCFILVPRAGLLGAIYASLIATILLFLFNALICWKIFDNFKRI